MLLIQVRFALAQECCVRFTVLMSHVKLGHWQLLIFSMRNPLDNAVKKGNVSRDRLQTASACERMHYTRNKHKKLPSSSCKARTIQYYNRNARNFFDSTVNRDLTVLYTPFLSNLALGDYILDAGCGSGRDSKAFLKRGYRVKAIDASSSLIRMATTFIGQKCEVRRFDKIGYKSQFDGIWACASLLHIPKPEIALVLKRLVIALKPRGLLFISMKKGKGDGFVNGRYFSLYSRGEIVSLVSNVSQLKLLTVWETRSSTSFPKQQSWLNCLAIKLVNCELDN